MNRKTHLLGTIRKNRKGLPAHVTQKQIDKGQVIGKESLDGIVVGKWKDKREVYFLTTRDKIDMEATGKKDRNRQPIMKPSAIIKYNKAKQGVDISDQMASYFLPLRKTIRWFHKVAFELLFNTAIVNSCLLFNHFQIEIGRKPMQITTSRKYSEEPSQFGYKSKSCS